MVRAILAGLAVFAAAYLLSLFAPASTWREFVAPGLAGFAASWIAPRRRILVGLATALVPTVLYAVPQAICELTGHGCGDRVGISGAAFLTAFTLMWNLVICGGGAVAAAALRSMLAGRSA